MQVSGICACVPRLRCPVIITFSWTIVNSNKLNSWKYRYLVMWIGAGGNSIFVRFFILAPQSRISEDASNKRRELKQWDGLLRKRQTWACCGAARLPTCGFLPFQGLLSLCRAAGGGNWKFNGEKGCCEGWNGLSARHKWKEQPYRTDPSTCCSRAAVLLCP